MKAKLTTGRKGCVFYDGERALARRGFAMATLQNSAGVPPARRALQREQSEIEPLRLASLGLGRRDARPTLEFAEIHLQLADGCEFGGANALVEIARRIWWAWPLGMFIGLPGIKTMSAAFYRCFACRRHCLGGACMLPGQAPHHRHTAFLEIP